MNREIVGICISFIVIFTAISLLSYHPSDPSLIAGGIDTSEGIHNLFGFIGAQISGLLIGLFGVGAFWIPVLLVLIGIHLWNGYDKKDLLSTIGGGVLLLFSTGALFAVRRHDLTIFGNSFPTGGVLGIPFSEFIIKYSNAVGGIIILILLWMIGFILATGISLITVGKKTWRLAAVTAKHSTQIAHIPFSGKDSTSSAAGVSVSGGDGTPKKLKSVKKAKTSASKKAASLIQKVTGIKSPAKRPEIDITPILPSDTLLDEPDSRPSGVNDDKLQSQSAMLEHKLQDFGVSGKIVGVTPGPVVTTFEYEPASGIKVNKIVRLADDLALTLKAVNIRIVAPVPGKAAVGIEIPNTVRETVRLKEIISADVYTKSKSKLTLCLGKDIGGNPVVAKLDEMPHLLIAGATGAGKSVGLNTMICSLLYKSGPEDVKLILIDPKKIEFPIFEGTPHLVTPVVTDPKKATRALFWAVREMENRYTLLADYRVKNISQFNRKIEKDPSANGEKLPYIVIIIDELADLMMVASRDVESALMRLAQMARAAGIHLILATQRPSVDVLTGVIKANFPTRLSYKVSSKIDSRTILDANGAEQLLGSGDMLFLPPGTDRVQRIHGAYISEDELLRITEHLKERKTPEYDETVIESSPSASPAGPAPTADTEYDEKYDAAVALVTKTRQASIALIQKQLRIGYNRALKIIETMEKEGVIGPAKTGKPREVLVRGYDDAS